jgi:hypothetical protein
MKENWKLRYGKALKSDLRNLWKYKFSILFFIIAFLSEDKIDRLYWVVVALFVILDTEITDIKNKLDTKEK